MRKHGTHWKDTATRDSEEEETWEEDNGNEDGGYLPPLHYTLSTVVVVAWMPWTAWFTQEF